MDEADVVAGRGGAVVENILDDMLGRLGSSRLRVSTEELIWGAAMGEYHTASTTLDLDLFPDRKKTWSPTDWASMRCPPVTLEYAASVGSVGGTGTIKQ